MDWLLANWQDLALAATSIVTGASIIAKLTPTKKDDEFIGKLLKFIDTLAINPKRK